MSNRQDASGKDAIDEALDDKGRVPYTIRLPRNVARIYETYAQKAGCSATKAVTEGAIRGAYTLPAVVSDEEPEA